MIYNLKENIDQATIYIKYIEKYFRETKNRCENRGYHEAVNSMNNHLDEVKMIIDSIETMDYPGKQLQELKEYFLYKSKKDHNFKTYLTAVKKLDDILFNLEFETLPEEVFNG